jgi:hypothetical protein
MAAAALLHGMLAWFKIFKNTPGPALQSQFDGPL